MIDAITSRAMRTPLIGAAVALTTGLAFGGALRPTLIGEAGLIGPQVIVGSAGARATRTSDLAFMSYSGPLPDYVLGTDMLRPPVADGPPAGNEAEIHEEAPPPPEPAWDYAEAVYDVQEETAEPPPSYPSTDGGVPYGTRAVAPSMEPLPTDLAGDVAAG